MKNNKVPVLLIGFNRAREIKAALDEIIKYQPSALYISLDAPRQGNLHDDLECRNVQKIIDAIDVNFPVRTQKFKVNQGCRKAVVGAIDWFFSRETEGIILEDDIIPHPAFFDFVSSMLLLFRDDKQVSSVLGFNLYGQGVSSSDYFFYEGFYPWGWGTWSNRWKQYSDDDYDIKKLISDREKFGDKRYLLNSLILNLTLIRNGMLDTWDYQFMYMMYSNNLLSIAPKANLIKNIGYDGAHSVGNILDFEYGVMESTNCFVRKDIFIDKSYNQLFLDEHYYSRRLTGIKMWLVKFQQYSRFRQLYRSLRSLWYKLRNRG